MNQQRWPAFGLILVVPVIAFCVFIAVRESERANEAKAAGDKFIRKPASTTIEFYSWRFDDYVVVTAGFYEGFEGWVISEEGGWITIRLNEDRLKANYLREHGSIAIRRHSLTLKVPSKDLKKIERPILKGKEKIYEQADIVFEYTCKNLGGWLQSDIIEIDGYEYQVAVKCVAKLPEDQNR